MLTYALVTIVWLAWLNPTGVRSVGWLRLEEAERDQSAFVLTDPRLWILIGFIYIMSYVSGITTPKSAQLPKT